MSETEQPAAKRLRTSSIVTNTNALSKSNIRLIAKYCALDTGTLVNIAQSSKLCKEALEGVTVFVFRRPDNTPGSYWNAKYGSEYDATYLAKSSELDQVVALDEYANDDKFKLYQTKFTEQFDKTKLYGDFLGSIKLKDINTPYSFQFKELSKLGGICYDLYDLKYLKSINNPRVLPQIIDLTVKQSLRNSEISPLFQSIDISRNFNSLKTLNIEFFDFCSASVNECFFLKTLKRLKALISLVIDQSHFRTIQILIKVLQETNHLKSVTISGSSFPVRGKANFDMMEYANNVWPPQFQRLAQHFENFNEFEPYEVVNKRAFFDAYR